MDIKYVNLGLFYVETADGRSGVITTMIDEFGYDTDAPDEAVAAFAVTTRGILVGPRGSSQWVEDETDGGLGVVGLPSAHGHCADSRHRGPRTKIPSFP